MRRTVMMVIMCAALAMPVVAMADDQTIPPEARWSPTPPVRQTADGNQLASVVVDKGMISPHEHAQLTRPQASSPAPHSRARAWTWEEIDRNPTRSTGVD